MEALTDAMIFLAWHVLGYIMVSTLGIFLSLRETNFHW